MVGHHSASIDRCHTVFICSLSTVPKVVTKRKHAFVAGWVGVSILLGAYAVLSAVLAGRIAGVYLLAQQPIAVHTDGYLLVLFRDVVYGHKVDYKNGSLVDATVAVYIRVENHGYPYGTRVYPAAFTAYLDDVACPLDERYLQLPLEIRSNMRLFPDTSLGPGEAAEGWLWFTMPVDQPVPWASIDDMTSATFKLRCELPQPYVICYERTLG